MDFYTDPNWPPFHEGQEVVGWHPMHGSAIKHMREYTITSCHYFYCANGGRYYWYVGVHDKDGKAYGYPDSGKNAHLGFITPRIFRAKSDLQEGLIMKFSEIKEAEIEQVLLMN